MGVRVRFCYQVFRGLAAGLACLWFAGGGAAAADMSVYSPHYVVSTYAGYAGQGNADGVGLTQAQFAYPQGVAVDAAGNRYVADTVNHTIRKVTPAGVVSTLAGLAGAQGFRNGTAGEAWFNSPLGIAVSADGSKVFVADTGNQVLRRINTATGLVTTVAGAVGETGAVDGTETSARFNSPAGLALAADGTLYVADAGNNRVRKLVFGSGMAVTVTTVAGNGTLPAGSLDGIGAAAKLNQPVAVALNSGGTELYVAETAGQVVRRITLSSASVVTLAGAAGVTGTADGSGGAGGAARFNKPSGLALNPAGTELFVADQESNTLRKITVSSGAVTTVAGSAGVIGSVSGAALGAALFRLPTGLAYDSVAGGVVVADTFNSQLRLYDPVAATVTTLAGAPEARNSTDGAAATARFNTPAALALHSDGTLYVADRENHLIRKITPQGVVSTLAGMAGAAGTADGMGGAGGVARFNYPSALALNATGTELFVADGDVNIGRVRRILLSGGVATVSTLLGVFKEPRGLAVTASGLLYVSETGDGKIWVYATPSASPIVVEPGVLRESGLLRPWGLAVGTGGEVYVADSYNQLIKKWIPGAPTEFGILAGASGGGANDAIGTAAKFLYPSGVAVDATGNLYVSEQENQQVRRITPAGVVTTLAGRPQEKGFADSAEGSARFKYPLGLAVSADGSSVYVADGDNHSIRKLSLIPAPTVSSASTAGDTYGQAFIYNIQAAPAITAYGLTGTLPAGLEFNSQRGQITGTPTVAGVYNVTVSATNATGTTSLNLTITITKQPVTITFTEGGLSSRWDGTARVPVAETSNGIHTVSFTYNGSATPPTKVGTYTVVATVNEPNFTGTATGTFTVLPPEAYTVGTLPGGAGVDADALAVDGAGNVYIADAGAGLIRKLTPAGILSDVALTGAPGGFAPTGIAVAADGTLYVSDSVNGRICRISSGGTVDTLVEGFTTPAALILSRDATKLFLLDSDGNGGYVRQIRLADGNVTTLASKFVGLEYPRGLAENPDGTLFVTDSVGKVVYEITTDSVLPAIAGQNALNGSADGVGNQARFNEPFGLIVASDGALLVSDSANNTLRRIEIATAAVSTVAGLAGTEGEGFFNGTGSAALLAGPRSLALRPDGAVVFADTTNHALRLATPPPSVPVITSALTAQGTQSSAFTYALTASGIPITYAASGLPSGLAIDSGSGLISGTPTESGVFTVTLTAGNAVGDGQASLVLTIAPPTYPVWQASYFTPTEVSQTALGAAAADPDGDGFANFIEYALGTNPRSASSVPMIQSSIQSGYLQLTYSRLRAHSPSTLSFTPEVSTNLQTWQSGASYLQEISVNALNSAREQVVVRSLSPLALTGRSFVRLRVSVVTP